MAFISEEHISCTENGDKAFSTSLNKNLDFFTKIVRDAPIDVYVNDFKAAWIEDKKTAVRILMNLRDIRDGKGEKMIPIAILVCLRRSLDMDVYKEILRRVAVDYGCWKDILKVYHISKMCGLTQKDSVEIDLFVDQLSKDIEAVNSDPDGKVAISLCAKWAPTEGSHFDKVCGFAVAIAGKMSLTMKQYRLMLTKLRKHLNILEMLMCTNNYHLIKFNTVPSVAMKNYAAAFKRDHNFNGIVSEKRTALKLSYQEYLSKLVKGEEKVNVVGIQPHEIVGQYLNGKVKTIDPLIESQWNEIVKRVMKSGALKNAVAVCDVSGSMSGLPMDVSVALGILTAQCVTGAYRNKVCTFSDNPNWHQLCHDNLMENVQSLSRADWSMSTNLRGVFDLILERAISERVKQEDMIEKIFIFTDMQFNSAVNSSESTFEYAKRTYEEAGYKLPTVIFWNLRTSNSKTMPVLADENNVVLLSGFSAELLKNILDATDFTPVSMMKHILSKYNVPESLFTCQSEFLLDSGFVSSLETSVRRSLFKAKTATKKNN